MNVLGQEVEEFDHLVLPTVGVVANVLNSRENVVHIVKRATVAEAIELVDDLLGVVVQIPRVERAIIFLRRRHWCERGYSDQCSGAHARKQSGVSGFHVRKLLVLGCA